MAKLELTYTIAHAAATDAANKRMREQSRQFWDFDDYAFAVATFNRLMGIFDDEAEQDRMQVYEEPY